MLLSDLLPLLYQNQVPMPLGGPVAPMLPKAASNATGGNIPAVKTPPISSPSDMMNAASQAQNVAGENKLRDMQTQLAAATVGLMREAGKPIDYNSLMSALTGGQGQSPSTASGAAASSGANAEAAEGGSPAVSSTTADATMEPEQRALLDSISGPESKGAYNVRYTPSGGTTFEGYGDHPRIAERGPAGPSTAAGRYQIVASTWDPVAQKLGLPDFSQISQDRAAWDIADSTYRQKTGGDLLADLKNGDTSKVASALSGQWPTIGRAIGSYSRNLSKYSQGGSAIANPESSPAIPELPDTRLAGLAGALKATFGGGAAPTGSGYATSIQSPAMPQSAATLGSAFGSLAPSPPASTAGPSAPLPVLTPKYVFGTPTAPSNFGHIVPPAVPSYGTPAPDQPHGPIPPGYKPPSPLAGATFGAATPANAGMAAPAAPNAPLPNGPAPQRVPFSLGGPAMSSAPPPSAVSPQMMPQGGAFGSLAPSASPMMPGGAFSPQAAGALAQLAQRANINNLLGKPVNPVDQKLIELAMAGPVERQKLLATKPIELQYAEPMASAQAWAKVQPELFTKWNSPVNARPGGGVLNPATGELTGTVPTLQKTVDPATGQERWQYMSPLGPQAANASGGVGGSPGVAGLGPGERQALVTRAEKEQADRQTVITEANAAQQQRATLLNMANDAGNFVQGPFAPHAQAAARYLRLIDPRFDGQVASYEDFIKNAGSLTRQAVRETSSRAAVQEFQLIGNTLPSPELSQVGLQRVQNELIGLTDYRLAKAQAQSQWEAAHGGPGNVTGFETAFQQQASPYAFIVARMSQPDRQEMFAKLQSSAQGRQELARLGQQLQFLKQSGLAQ